jgi:cell division protein FtsB
MNSQERAEKVANLRSQIAVLEKEVEELKAKEAAIEAKIGNQ